MVKRAVVKRALASRLKDGPLEGTLAFMNRHV